MARSFLTSLNLNQNQIQNAVVQPLGSAPSSPVAGQIYYSTVSNAAFVYNGSGWAVADATKATGIPTSAIASFQSTVQGYALSSFATPTGNIAMGGYTLTGLNTSPNASGQAAEYSWVVGRNLNAIAGATATNGNIPMAGYKFTGLGTPSGAGDSAEYSWVLNRPLSAFAVPTANVAMNGYTLTGLNASPSAAGQAAEYSWVLGQIQSSAAGIASKGPVIAVSTSNISSLSGLPTVDGVTMTAGQRLLLAGQTTASQNGPYLVASSSWSRPTTDAANELDPGATWLVTQGTTYAGSQWRMATTGTITVGTTSISIVQFSASSPYAAGNGLTLTGTQFAVNPVSSGGILASGSGVSVDTTIVARKYSTTIGDGSATSFTVTHSLGTQDVIMMVRQAATPFSSVECDMSSTSTTTCTIAFAAAPAANSYRVTVLG